MCPFFWSGYVSASASPTQLDLARVHLGRLPLGRRRLHLALDDDAGPGVQVLDLALVVGQFARGDDLHVALARAVVELDEAEAALGVAAGADPAAEADLAADGLRGAGVGDGDRVHAALRDGWAAGVLEGISNGGPM